MRYSECECGGVLQKERSVEVISDSFNMKNLKKKPNVKILSRTDILQCPVCGEKYFQQVSAEEIRQAQ